MLKLSFLKSLNTKFRNNNKIAKRLGYILLTSFIIFCVVGFFIFAHIRGYEEIIYVEKDAHVYEYYPDENYGADDFLRVGNYISGKTQTFYHFNISSLPKGWREVEVHVNFDYGSKMVDVGAVIVHEDWDEMNITWNNKPTEGIYRGHIMCDGFDFRIPLESDHIINDGVSIVLYGRGGEDDGYIQSYSKEGTSKNNDIAWIELNYRGIDPIILSGLSIFGIILGCIIAIVGALVLSLVSVSKFKKTWKRRANIIKNNPYGANWLENNISKAIKVPPLEKKINEYITIRLERGRTYIYVNEKRFIQCIRLILNILKEDVTLYDEIESIDEAAKIYSTSIHQNRIIGRPVGPGLHGNKYGITPEQEFWGHCSNIQAWVEHDYDTRILMHNIAFPLLRELTKVGDPRATKVYKEDIAERLESGYPPVVQYLITQEFIEIFTPTEFLTILESTTIIKNLTAQPNMLSQFFRSCSVKFPTLLKDIFVHLLKLPNGKKSFISSMVFDLRAPAARPLRAYHDTHLNILKSSLESLILQVDEKTGGDVLDCIQCIDSKLKGKPFYIPERSGKSLLNAIKNEILNGVALDDLDERDKLFLKQRILGRIGKMQSKCAYCGKVIPEGKNVCDWCGHKRDDDEGFFPYPFIYKPPGGGGGGRFKEGAISIPVRA